MLARRLRPPYIETFSFSGRAPAALAAAVSSHEARTAMMYTLHSYVLRELLTLCAHAGGPDGRAHHGRRAVQRAMRYEGAKRRRRTGLLPMLIPIMVALAMPVAVIFATTMVYGRLAADNEFTACRAAGINVHKLFVGALLVSVFVAVFTLLFGDLVVPDVTRAPEPVRVRANLRDLALQRMETKGLRAISAAAAPTF